MADMTTTAPTQLIPAIWDRALGAWTQLASFVAHPRAPKTDHLLQDAGLHQTEQLSPLSQDAATAMHLMSLGQWY